MYLARRTGVADASTALDAATEDLAAGKAGADDEYSTALEHWLALGAADFEVRILEVLDDVGLTAWMLHAETASLSGGEAAKVGLAAVLLSRFDVLLLDEPTNDLDFAGLDRLEQFVLAFSGPLIVVSHDRTFLDRVVTHVAELDAHDHSISVFAGGWAAYQYERELARKHAEAAYAEYEGQRDDLRSRAQRERQWATQGVNKEKKSPRDGDKLGRKFRQEKTEQLASRARRTERAMDRLDCVEKPWEEWELRFNVAAAPRAGAVVARLDQAVVSAGRLHSRARHRGDRLG